MKYSIWLFNSQAFGNTINHHKEGTGLGLAISKQLVDNPNRRTPIIALTADAVAGVREELLNREMDDLMKKEP